MSPLELIKIGLLENNLEKIRKGYENLTGEAVEFINPNEVSNEEIREILAEKNKQEEDTLLAQENSLIITPFSPAQPGEIEEIAEEEEEEIIEDNTSPESEVITVTKNKKVSLTLEEPINDEEFQGAGTKQCMRVPFVIGKRVNRFKDNPSIAVDDTKNFDKKVRTAHAIAQKSNIDKRPAPAKIVVSCRGCHRKFRVDPLFVPAHVGGDRATYECDNCRPKRRN